MLLLFPGPVSLCGMPFAEIDLSSVVRLLGRVELGTNPGVLSTRVGRLQGGRTGTSFAEPHAAKVRTPCIAAKTCFIPIVRREAVGVIGYGGHGMAWNGSVRSACGVKISCPPY